MSEWRSGLAAAMCLAAAAMWLAATAAGSPPAVPAQAGATADDARSALTGKPAAPRPDKAAPAKAGARAPAPAPLPQRTEADRALLAKLDAPLLFTRQANYQGIHIYDVCYKWYPGGGIYVLENPADPPDKHRVRAVVDPASPGSPGSGVYSDPELSYDATKLLFCFKGQPKGSTCIYEVNIDGSGLRRLTDPGGCHSGYCGRQDMGGEHDLAPCYLPDGRIVFNSTRRHGLVPCFNAGVAVLHVMDADGGNIRAISVNNVNEFDPCVLPDGRVLYGRWEYVDKTALTQQSLWTILPDGTHETALFANNMVHPEATLQARPVPGTQLVAAALTPHNAPPRGTVAMIDPLVGKDDPRAIFNFDTPANPTNDRGESCDPWPLSPDLLVYSGRTPGAKKNAILLADRSGRKVVVVADEKIDLHAPMLVKPRPLSPLPAAQAGRAEPGRFFVQDIYRGLDGVPRGAVKRLRVIEETSRVSGTHGNNYNQTFLASAALAFGAKIFLGTVPVQPDGSAYFQAPPGRALYFQALDANGQLVRGMRTFVQASAGTTRSCIGCHEYKYGAPAGGAQAAALDRPPSRLRDETWGSGFIDYARQVQPILDRHCVSCHGGAKGFAARLDLSGGWTENFNISYENLASRGPNQLTARLIAGIDCMNGTSLWSARIFDPYEHGSGAAPLAKVLLSGHAGRIAALSRAERDLLLAWIDTNGLYYGTWDYSKFGCFLHGWREVVRALQKEMAAAGCARCHGAGRGALTFENDWVNLRHPEWSRLLRAPLTKRADGPGLALCLEAKADPARRRLHLLDGGYIHAVTPLDRFAAYPHPPPPKGRPAPTFASTDDTHYQAMLAAIRTARQQALAAPRVDMPGAEPHVTPGRHRVDVPPPLPRPVPAVTAETADDGMVILRWQRSARTIGLTAEVHRTSAAGAAPDAGTLLGATPGAFFVDPNAPPGLCHYAVVFRSGDRLAAPSWVALRVPARPSPPEARP